jgi:iron-sulfur cluster assembly accessory protein
MVTQLEQDTTEATPVLNVTPGAVSKIKELLTARNLEDHALRVFVSGGGCSGLQYGMAIEKEAEDFDTTVEVDGVRLLVDSNSLPYLTGANIDYIDDLMGGGFRIDNPNAVSSCGCGHSFRTADSQGASGGGCGSCG